MSEPLVSVRGLKRSFHRDGATVSVLKGIDFEVGEGEFATIMGPSGAGKTTFLHIIGSLDQPTEGEVFYRGKDISLFTGEEQCRFRNEKVGFVFQFYHLLQDFTVLENIMIPLWIKRAKAAEAQGAAEEFLRIMGLADRRHHKPGELSGGEQQRVAIARALINRPELILADEPTGNLDRKTGRVVLEYILSVRERIGAALILVTHDPEIGASGKRRLTMVDGELFPAK
jgi:lipoprotein-releasing system ATP-binding protein